MAARLRLVQLPYNVMKLLGSGISGYELELMALIDRQYLHTPFYGSRRMTAWLQTRGHMVNRKRGLTG